MKSEISYYIEENDIQLWRKRENTNWNEEGRKLKEEKSKQKKEQWNERERNEEENEEKESMKWERLNNKWVSNIEEEAQSACNENEEKVKWREYMIMKARRYGPGMWWWWRLTWEEVIYVENDWLNSDCLPTDDAVQYSGVMTSEMVSDEEMSAVMEVADVG